MDVKRPAAELFGTFVFFLIGLLSILSTKAFGSLPSAVQGADLVVIAFGFGLGLFVAIQAFGAISGGHFNPAVTIAAVLDGRLDWASGVRYIVAQLIGGIGAAVLVLAISNQPAIAGTRTVPGAGITDNQAVVLEAVLTAIFILVILTSTKRTPSQAAFAIPLTLLVIHFALVPFTGASVNPTRSIASAVVGADLSSLWIYLVGPIIGAVLGWGVYRYTSADTAAG